MEKKIGDKLVFVIEEATAGCEGCAFNTPFEYCCIQTETFQCYIKETNISLIARLIE